jgi:O-antigen ligase/Flp pilus assembly protein TadD
VEQKTPDADVRLSAPLRAAMEAVVLLLVVLLPWAFGGARAVFEFALFVGVAVLMVLWAARMLLEGRPILAACPITLCLAGLFLLGAWQITPISPSALRSLSPGTAEMNAKLLPQEPEGDSTQAGRLAAGHTVSLHPAGTQAQLLRLLALIALFAAVRGNVASPGSFRRLAVVALVNGSLLALVGLLQFFSSPRGLIYWTFPTPAAAFGAMNRNDFAGHLNLCLGLGIGVLLARRLGPRSGRAWDDPVILWTGAGLVLMLTALGLCLSRGGVFSLLGAVAIVAVVGRCASGGWRFGVVLLLLCLALGLAAWFGLDEVRGRMAGLWKDDSPGDDRWRMWVQTAPFARTFPTWGSGFGTFPFLERMSRPPHAGPDLIQDNAHNEYLNLLLEGGLVGLVVGLAALVMAYVLGVRAFLRHREGPTGGLALGGLVALSSIALHSLVDYGMHLPAIAVLAVVVVAQLAALGGDGAATPARPRGWSVGRFAAAVVGAAAVVLVAWVLTTQGYARHQAVRYHNAAAKLEGSSEPAARQRRLDYLRAAAETAPADAEAQQALADALYETFRTERDGLRARADAGRAAALVGGPTWASPYHAAAAAALADAAPSHAGPEERRLTQEYLRPALARYLAARSLCPLLPRPHVALATSSGDESPDEPASAHLTRARLLMPYDARVWFVSGAHELREGKSEQAWRSWRRSLECSDEFLEEIVTRCREHLAPEALVDSVLPGDPELVYQAALLLETEDQPPLLERAVALARTEPNDGKDDLLLLEARALMRLGRTADAADAFGRLAARSPGRVEWRYEFAQALHELGRLDEARRELRLLLQQQPDHRPAAELYRQVVRRLSEER